LTSYPWVHFIRVLQADFTHTDSKCAKKTVKSSSVSFALLGPTSIKAAHKMLMKFDTLSRLLVIRLIPWRHKSLNPLLYCSRDVIYGQFQMTEMCICNYMCKWYFELRKYNFFGEFKAKFLVLRMRTLTSSGHRSCKC